MEIYVVGGAVRDMLLDREAKDIDYVVVGSSPEEMISLGFIQVGADFPVFLKDGCEYALARTERKTGVGYTGFETKFDSNVTLTDDLRRRDLTINSMAVKLEHWEDFVRDPHRGYVIDPFWGHDDLIGHVLHPTSDAFSEDPVRVLRLARFAARYGFYASGKANELMKQVMHELNHVPQERIWAEFAKGLTEQYPEHMIDILQGIGAFEVEALRPYKKANVFVMNQIKEHTDLMTRFVAISGAFEDKDYDTCRIPWEYARMSKAVHNFGPRIVRYQLMAPSERLDIMEKLRAINDQDFAINVFHCAHVLYDGNKEDMPSMSALMDDLRVLATVDTAAIASSCKTGQEIKGKIRDARIQAMS